MTAALEAGGRLVSDRRARVLDLPPTRATGRAYAWRIGAAKHRWNFTRQAVHHQDARPSSSPTIPAGRRSGSGDGGQAGEDHADELATLAPGA
jgi:hypothetical protein